MKAVSGYAQTATVTPVNNNTSSSAWNTSKAVINKDTKDKAMLFKSQKYIRDFKGTPVVNNDSGISVKKE